MDIDNVLKTERAFYEAHKAEFHEKYYNKWLVIAGESFLGAYDTPKEARENAEKHCANGDFMIHRPSRDDIELSLGPGLYTGFSKKDEDYTSTTAIDDSDGEIIRYPYAPAF